MPKSDSSGKARRLLELCMLYWKNPGLRLRTPEIAAKLEVDDDTVRGYLRELSENGRLPLTKDGQFWILPENARLELSHISLTIPEAVALFVAGRLHAQIHDERNIHVIQALTKVVGAMPQAVATHQHKIVDMARERQQGQPDRSAIFEAVAMGWATQRKVRLLYEPPHGRTFESIFAPYLLEPSGIGRTIYAIGHSTLQNKLRTFKLERIQHAELLSKDPFDIPGDFDGPELLKRAWGVMYGDEECIEVRLRFSSWVEKRVKETVWHPSQQVRDTPQGCEVTFQIGDTLEIENWIRGWGSDCEVLAPQPLRDTMIRHVRRLAAMYEIHPTSNTAPDEPDTDFLSQIFGG